MVRLEGAAAADRERWRAWRRGAVEPLEKVFSAGRLVGAEKGPYSVPHSVLLSALPDNIYLHKLDQEIGRIQQKYEIPIVQRIRSVLLRTGRIDDQEDSGDYHG
ncbi:hypothetical protein R6Q57_003631 [Mikania cordata]